MDSDIEGLNGEHKTPLREIHEPMQLQTVEITENEGHTHTENSRVDDVSKTGHVLYVTHDCIIH